MQPIRATGSSDVIIKYCSHVAHDLDLKISYYVKQRHMYLMRALCKNKQFKTAMQSPRISETIIYVFESTVGIGKLFICCFCKHTLIFSEYVISYVSACVR